MRYLYLLIACSLVGVGCSGGDDAVKVPETATKGGNVVNDPKLKEQLMGGTTIEPQGGLSAK